MMELLQRFFFELWHLLLESSVYILFGITIAGLLRVVLSADTVFRHLGEGRYRSVVKAALLGIPLPLCSCGVLPAAAGLRRQGANKGATTAFLISTPESGVDSIAITYALLDPLMTVARPVAALVTAISAGIAENLLFWKKEETVRQPAQPCLVDGCCDGVDCPPDIHNRHHRLTEKIRAGMIYAYREVWGDIVGWFAVGLLLAALITTLVPDQWMARFLGGGLGSMLVMLVIGIPLYICATASTPIAAALIMKGVSPGAALVFLLVGPATNITSLVVLSGMLGKRSTALYLGILSLAAVLFGLAVDAIYLALMISPLAIIGEAGEVVPDGLKLAAALLLIILSVRPLAEQLKTRLRKRAGARVFVSDFPVIPPNLPRTEPPAGGPKKAPRPLIQSKGKK